MPRGNSLNGHPKGDDHDKNHVTEYDPIERCILTAVEEEIVEILKKIDRHFRGKLERMAILQLWETPSDEEGLVAALRRIIEGGEEHGDCAELSETYRVPRPSISKQLKPLKRERAVSYLQRTKEVIETSNDVMLANVLPDVKRLLSLFTP
jgi:hypothetical protein